MADDWLTLIGPPAEATTRNRASRWLTVRYRLTPWWGRVLLVFLVSRVVTTTLLLAFAAAQKPNSWTGAHPSYLDFARIWDGNWYYIVAVTGYPSTLPMTADGLHIGENAWAFLPAYPMLVRLLMTITGLGFPVLAVFVSVAFAAGTSLLFYRVMRTRLPDGAALFSVVLFCFAPLSPILQVAYAESMFAFFLTLSLYLLVTRRYALMFPAVLVLAFTRPGTIALVIVIVAHIVQRLVTRRRDPFDRGERVLSIGIAVFTAAASLAWPVIAWLATGDRAAYTDTELAWRSPYVGWVDLLPFTPWVQGANWWIPQRPLGPILLVLGVLAFAAFMFLPVTRRLGLELRVWSAGYVLYLLAVFFPQSSTFRILMPTFPLFGALAQPRSRIYRTGIVLVFIALQWGWLYIAWWVNGYDWTPP